MILFAQKSQPKAELQCTYDEIIKALLGPKKKRKNNKNNKREQRNKVKLGSKQAMRKEENKTTRIKGNCC